MIKNHDVFVASTGYRTTDWCTGNLVCCRFPDENVMLLGSTTVVGWSIVVVSSIAGCLILILVDLTPCR